MDEYADLRKEHDLPEFEALDKVFEVSSLSLHGFPLKEIRRHVAEKLSTNAEILEDIIHPNSTVSAYHECKFFTDEDKRELYDLYARLMRHIRQSNVLDVGGDDKGDALFIRTVHDEWPGMKEALHKILSRMRDSWNSEEIIDKSMSSYFG